MFDIVKLRGLLPSWGDGDPAFWVMYTRVEDGDIEKGPSFNHDLTAYCVADWLVHSGMVHSAFVVAAVTRILRKPRETQNVD